jgi:hypothetical protein
MYGLADLAARRHYACTLGFAVGETVIAGEWSRHSNDN